MEYELKLSEVQKYYLLFLHGFKVMNLTEQFQVRGLKKKKGFVID